MFNFAANLTMLFTGAPFMERFALARQAGFTSVEYLFPYDFAIRDLKAQLNSNGLTQILFNLPAGDWAAGERGIAANPSRVDEFCAGVAKAIEYAKALGVTRLNCLAGKALPQFTREQQWAALVQNVRYAAREFQPHGLTLLVEAVNHFDVPGFFLNRTDDVLKLLDEASSPNILVQYDMYHAHREGEDIAATLRKHIAKIGHVQIADSPGRHEPGTGEIPFLQLLKELDALGYDGFVGLEYIPTPGREVPSAASFDIFGAND